VARDRKRAKQRRARRGTAVAPRGPSEIAKSSESQPVRADLPGALDHASGEVDEFDAALVRGAGGVPAPSESTLPAAGSEDELQEGSAGGGGSGGGASGAGGGGEAGGGEQASGAPLRGGNRAIGFLRASWAELQRVQWPDRRQVTQATAVVLGFVAIAGAYLGLADYVAKEIVELIL
jgi:preprotein translocase subunit SecE